MFRGFTKRAVFGIIMDNMKFGLESIIRLITFQNDNYCYKIKTFIPLKLDDVLTSFTWVRSPVEMGLDKIVFTLQSAGSYVRQLLVRKVQR